jgi:hypothetical protein
MARTKILGTFLDFSSSNIEVTSDSSSFIRNSTDNDLKFTFVTNNASDFAQLIMDGKDGGSEKFMIAYGSTHGSTPNMLALKSNDSSAGSVGFFTASTERARFDVNGRLGIGTTSPSQKLDVAGIIQSTSTNPQVRINTSSGTGAGYLVFGDSGDDDRGWISYLHASDALQFRVNASERLRIDSSGNVSIGISSVQTQGALTGNLLEIHEPGFGSGVGGTLVLSSDNTANGRHGGRIIGRARSYVHSSIDFQADSGMANGGRLIFRTLASGSATTDNPTERMRIDSSGRLSVGISSSAGGVATFFGTGTGAEAKVQIEGEGGADPFINFLVNNTTHWAVGARDSDSDKFMIANNSDLSSGVALTINSAKNVGIGTTSPVDLGGHDGVLTLFGSNATALVLKNDTSSSRLAQLGSDLGFFVATYENERMRLTSTGLGIGTTSPARELHVKSSGQGVAAFESTAAGLVIQGSSSTTSLAEIVGYKQTGGGYHDINIRAGVGAQLYLDTNGNVGIGTDTPAQKLEVAGNIKVNASNGEGFLLNSSSTTGIFRQNANDLGFTVGGSERVRIFSDGDVGLGGAETGNIINSSSGVGFYHERGADTVCGRNGGAALSVLRQGSDGEMIRFKQAGSQEGSINVSGATVSLQGFTGTHETSGIADDTAIGTVVSTIDELDTYVSGSKSGQTRAEHPKVKVSDSVGDSRVYGVLQSRTEADNKPLIASVGLGTILVTGACNGGDLLESNGDGTAKVQSDDIIRSKTIGKVTIGNSDTGVKLVSCVLYCG